MPLARVPALAALAGLALAGPAAAEPLDWVRGAQRAGTQALLLALRTSVDLTYEGLTVDRRSGDVIVTGLTLRPELDYDPRGLCAITADRLALSGISAPGGREVEILSEIDRIAVPSACLDPGAGAMMQSFGYEEIAVEDVTLRLVYDVPSGGAQVFLDAGVADAAAVEISADFDYLWLRTRPGDEDVEPVAILNGAEVVLENDGLYERIAPLVMLQLGNPAEAPDRLRALLLSVLSGAGGQPGPQAQAFANNLAEEVSRFLQEGDRLVLSLEPEEGVRLGDGLFQTPERAIAAFDPRVSSTPVSVRRLVSPSALRAALAPDAEVPDAERIRIGQALLSGVGAPLNTEAGTRLLAPLAERWDGRAADALAGARLSAGDAAGAYAMALRALAAGTPGAATLADRAEAEIDAGPLLAAQDAAFDAWPGRGAWVDALAAREGEADVGAIRRLAHDAAAGRDMPRSYRTAYRLASLAAAAGDAGAALLRDRLDARFTDPSGTVAPAWRDLRASVAEAVLEEWTASGGFGAAVIDDLRGRD